ncbi:hypothetical protein DMUE_1596 [Dictyocoela muelleri]|nr:hypothetical protein DMUE_1596 [Dictyocoela muelleri]
MGTWISFMDEIYTNYEQYSCFLTNLANTNIDHQTIIDKFKDNSFLSELKEIRAALFIVDSINKLENSNLSTIEQIDIIKYVAKNLKNPLLREKYRNLILKNPDLDFFFHLNPINSPEKDKIYLNVPLTTVDAERSFSKLSLIMEDSRRGMTVKSLEILNSLYFNDF